MTFKHIREKLQIAILVLVFTGVMGLSGCKKAKTVDLPFETVMKGNPAVHDSNGRGYHPDLLNMDLLIASNADEGQQITEKMWTDRPGLRFDEIPNIDYTKYILIIAYLGAYGHNGAEITIEKVTQTGSEVNVIVSTIEPTVGPMVTVSYSLDYY